MVRLQDNVARIRQVLEYFGVADDVGRSVGEFHQVVLGKPSLLLFVVFGLLLNQQLLDLFTVNQRSTFWIL